MRIRKKIVTVLTGSNILRLTRSLKKSGFCNTSMLKMWDIDREPVNNTTIGFGLLSTSLTGVWGLSNWGSNVTYETD